MKSLLLILQKYLYTHMPYIFYVDNLPRLYFTIMLDNYWKLYYTDYNKVYKVKTNLDTILNSTEYHMCQPCCYYKDQKYHVSFCIQYQGVVSLYYQLSTSPTNLKNLNLIANLIYGGCVSPNYYIIGKIDNTICFYNRKNDIDFNIKPDILMINSVSNIARLSYVYGNLNLILMSFASTMYFDGYGTILINLKNKNQLLLLTNDEKPIYKCSIDLLTETVLYGLKIGVGFEQRKISKTTLNQLKFKKGLYLTFM